MNLRDALSKVLLAALDSALVREQECRVDPEVRDNPEFTFEGFTVSRFRAEFTLTYKREDGAIREIKVTPEVDLVQGAELLEPMAVESAPTKKAKAPKKPIARTRHLPRRKR